MESTFDIIIFAKCLNFAAKKHRDQRRLDKEKTPYINHPIGVMAILSDAGVTDLNTLMGALLHDTVEDTDTTFEEIEEHFGSDVRKIVAEVTDDKTLPKMDRKRLQIEHANHCSDQAKLIKLADKIYNLRDLLKCTPEGWTNQRVREYSIWAKKVTDNMKGINLKLDEQLMLIFKKFDENDV
jgi:guanosine-3',5'-bis(diphosphate) 3'-pyrophosphohydrolase